VPKQLPDLQQASSEQHQPNCQQQHQQQQKHPQQA